MTYSESEQELYLIFSTCYQKAAHLHSRSKLEEKQYQQQKQKQNKTKQNKKKKTKPLQVKDVFFFHGGRNAYSEMSGSFMERLI